MCQATAIGAAVVHVNQQFVQHVQRWWMVQCVMDRLIQLCSVAL
jgi:hypothetical protein